MPIRVALNHRTEYVYERPIMLGPQVVRLRPAPHSRTPIESYSLRVSPTGHFLNWQQDPYGNYLARLVFPEKVTHFAVEVDLVAEMRVVNPFDFFLEPAVEEFPFSYDESFDRDLKPFRELQESGDLLKKYLTTVDRKKQRTIDFLVAVNQSIQRDVNYVIRMEPGVQTCEETLGSGKGSCRDSAWLLVQVLRHLGFATRFVSGYLLQLKPDEKSLDGPSGTEVDFTDLHAWTEVYLPGAGWIGLDPTSGLMAGEGHIPLACTPDPPSAAPISGLLEDCESDFSFSMTVMRVHEDPRVTKPFSDEEWAAIDALGDRIDAELLAGDVRLTMGGEPTFVSIDDMEGAEWNTEALGDAKRRLGGNLFRRLRNRFAQGALLHFGQGKWYPGEPLPRWAFSCFWRNDGEPMWHNPALIADDRTDYGMTEDDAKAMIHGIAARLGVDAGNAQPGFEDAFYYMWKERRLPTNVDPFDSKLENEEDRKRLAEVFEQGLDKVVGYALPLSKGRFGFGPEWISGPWFFRPERMYLAPGDSPMGFRLPLDSLPWAAAEEISPVENLDPTAPRRALPTRSAIRESARQRTFVEYRLDHDRGPAGQHRTRQRLPDPPSGARDIAVGESASSLVRTALCVEARGGRLHVFFPPVRTLEDYLEIVAAVEDTAAELQTPVQIEGYTPPNDYRLNVIKVTPDPGVIEVNTHPASTWRELVDATTGLYEEARVSRLGTEKYQLDGRHTGTGGGNHVVLGGPTPMDSPFLRRPDLLKSLVAYWHNHPSLSYLFSGLFVGPTSQAPRVDEARNDSVYELEIAFKQIRDGASPPPWFTDRVLRNLLVDLTGNTHRSEFCIDKLYSPDSSTGRLGLVEFRAFEMPPHARMSLAQQLLLRALTARFWREPYRESLVRWGTELHDRYMLPHFIWQDFGDVMTSLRSSGYEFNRDWYASFLEFRFPRIGDTQYRELKVELRQAVEPWLVLGEEATAGGTARYVDSSVERLQVKVTGLVSPRYALLCHGRHIPLQNTGTVGEYVAGIRYRAWQPPSCLHPNIGVHSPIVLDILDTWNRRIVGGCTYHVVHPGGRGYDVFPVNALEAESRRATRFVPYGHTPGPMAPPPREINPEFPFTLDLRH